MEKSMLESVNNCKVHFRFISVLCILLVLIVCFVCGCTSSEYNSMGTKNKTNTENTIDNTSPIFSDMGGFYSGEFEVTISVPNLLKADTSSIKITFDGSEPTAKSEDYTEALKLPGNNYTKTHFENADEDVKVSVIRAACFDKKGNILGQISTATYIQIKTSDGGSGKSRFNIPVISLVTDEDNLNSKSKGIFRNPDGHGAEWERPVNVSFYEPDGTLAFTQDAGIRLFGGSTRNLTQKSLRITARKAEYFDTTVYDGAGKFRYALFPERVDSFGNVLAEYDSFILRNGGNDSVFFSEDTARITFIRDGLAAKITKKAAPDVDVMDYRPVVVFLNGEYYGLMNLREYQNNKYIQNVYGIEDKEGITVISTELDSSRGGRYDGDWFYYEQDDGPEGELESFITLLDDISKGKYSYEQVSEKIDTDNFMKYCAMNLFLCNTDWPHNNTKVWRYAGENAGAEANTDVTDGKWRFMLKDADVGLGRFVCAAEKRGYPIELYTKADCKNIRFLLANYMEFNDTYGYPSVRNNTYPDTLKIQGLFYFCMQNKTFAQAFYDFCHKLTSEIWTPDALKKLIDSASDEIMKEFENYLVKEFGVWNWEANTTVDKWKNAVSGKNDSLYTWAEQRSGENGEFMKQVKELMNLLD